MRSHPPSRFPHSSTSVVERSGSPPGSSVTATLLAGKSVAGTRKVHRGTGLEPLRIALNGTGRRELRQARSLPLSVHVRIASPGRRTVSGSSRLTLSRG